MRKINTLNNPLTISFEAWAIDLRCEHRTIRFANYNQRLEAAGIITQKAIDKAFTYGIKKQSEEEIDLQSQEDATT